RPSLLSAGPPSGQTEGRRMLITAAAAELERTAAAYRDAAKVLRGIPDRAEQYLVLLQAAQQVEWSSEAGTAFRQLLEALRQPGTMLQAAAPQLAATAELIAADLSSYADTARQLATVVSALSGVDLLAVAHDLGADRVEGMRRAAAEAGADAASLVVYVQQNSGIPGLLREAA